MQKCAISILCHESYKIKALPLAMLKLNSALSWVEYQIPQNFSLVLSFSPSSSSLSSIFNDEDKNQQMQFIKKQMLTEKSN